MQSVVQARKVDENKIKINESSSRKERDLNDYL